MNFKIFDNPIFNVLTRVCDIFILNVLWIVCSIPIITIGASTTALYYSMLKINREADSSITGMFFHSFFQNLKQGCGLTIIYALSGLLLYVEVQLYKSMEGTLSNVLLIAIILMFVVWGVMLSYSFPILAQFDNTVIGTIKNSFLISFSHLKKTVIIFMLNAVIPLLLLVVPDIFFLCLPIWLTVGIAVVAFINSKLLVKVFDYYIEKDSGLVE